jgi:Domain of Unknown Function with PDB structure (DUF3857)/Transglutaminase-like superfamily
MEDLDTVEAFTEKPDGSKVPVGVANIITRDAASGLPGTYTRDLKQRTVIFQDVQVGDTLVMTHKKEMRQSLFPGQFFYSDAFARSMPFASAQVVVEAPDDLDLQVETIGRGLTEKVEDVDHARRHTVTLLPQPYQPEEAWAVSSIDRDPVLLISTFRSYKDIGLAYAAAAFPKAVITPEIADLADAITAGIDDRRQQAIAIDAWMKKNIRYVAVYLSLGRVVPNDAASVLRNKFGDCKDATTLMSALLAAKGVASEAVLINLGTVYTLPEPPTMVALNHVILYLPEFDLYDDPTAKLAAFGVLAAETYDKPVVRVGTSGATLARTPAMKPEDHTTHARTTIHVAADGTVTGQTEETNTGILGDKSAICGREPPELGQRYSCTTTPSKVQHTRYRTFGSRQFGRNSGPGHDQKLVHVEPALQAASHGGARQDFLRDAAGGTAGKLPARHQTRRPQIRIHLLRMEPDGRHRSDIRRVSTDAGPPLATNHRKPGLQLPCRDQGRGPHGDDAP